MVILGEVGLTGNVRSIPRIEQRINEAKKIGLYKVYYPSKGTIDKLSHDDKSIQIRGVTVNCTSDATRIFLIHVIVHRRLIH